MMTPTFAEFEELAGQGNLVPVFQELPADLETPVSVFLKLRTDGAAFLLESVEGGEQIGRYSFLAVGQKRYIECFHDHFVIHQNGNQTKQSLVEDQDPLSPVQALVDQFELVDRPDLPRFIGGAVGYMSYDLVRFIERLPATSEDDLELPICQFLLTNTMVIFDHVKHKLLVVALAHVDDDPQAAYSEAEQRIANLMHRLNQPLDPALRESRLQLPSKESAEGPASLLKSNMAQTRYEEIVRKAKDYITAGDIFQVVLSQRFARETLADAFTIYRALRMLNPSPYMVYLELGETQIISSSPEMHVRLEQDAAELRPIAGTRPRGKNFDEDLALEKELISDPKERAEHVMLVDLGRNDLGRVCTYGTVNVPELMVIERYSHVMHIVSSVKGQLNGKYNAFDLLRATFPAGTVSGAPKVRAMEIIEEMEQLRRHTYAGALGYFGYGGTMDTCITIRTILKQGSTAYIQAGAGIVADSDPTREYQECVNKAAALAEAITVAELGTT